MQQTNPSHHHIVFLNEIGTSLLTESYLLTAEITVKKYPDSRLFKAHEKLMGQIKGTYESPTQYIISRLFISQVAAFELFLQGVLTDVFIKNPNKVGEVKFTLNEVINSGGIETLVQRAIDEILYKLMYKKPLDYLTEVCKYLSIAPEPLVDDWRCFVEFKARRDLGVHNGWICNPTYINKVTEAGVQISAVEGDLMAPIDDMYLEQVHDVFERLSYRITLQVLKKHWPDLADSCEEAWRVTRPK